MSFPAMGNPTKTVFLRALGNSVIQTPISSLTPAQDVLFATALFLILNQNRKISRDGMEQALWPDLENSPNAHHRLRQTILKLKEAGFPIRRENGFLKCAYAIRTDFDEILATPKQNPMAVLPESFEFLPDYLPRISVGYAHWLDQKRLEVNASLVRILLEHIRFARNRGEWERVESLTRTCALIDPYNEEAVLARAESVALRGGKLEAMALLDEYVSELGTAPSEMRLPANLMRRRISERKDKRAYETPEIPLLGRANELFVLNTALESAASGAGNCCVIEADIGMGKSRLSKEFAEFAQLKGVEVKYTRCQHSERGRPLSLFVELAPNLRQIRGAIGCSPASLDCLDRLTMDGSSELATPRHSDPAAIAEHILAAVLDLLDAVTEEKPLLLIIDDAQWLDEASSALLETIAGWATHRKLLLVFCARAHSLPRQLSQRVSYTPIKLEPLPEEDVRSLVRALLGTGPKRNSQKATEWIVEVGEGNPFFIGELVRQWEETGRYHESPAPLAEITNQRLLRLSQPALNILQTCAVLGRFSTIERIERILEYKTFEFIDALNELGKCSMVRTETLPGESISGPLIVCTHELIASAAIKLLSPPARMAVHRRVGLILEMETAALYSPSIIAESALHWENAGEEKNARSLTTAYADHLMGIGFPSDAIDIYRRALTFCFASEQKAVVLPKLILALYSAGEWREVSNTIAELNLLKEGLENPGDHSHIEMIGLEAKWRSSTEWSDLLQEVKKCIFAETASPDHRVRAAVLGLKLATNVGTAEELDQIYTAVRCFLDEPTIDETSRLYVEMVYHIDRGDLNRGEIAAIELVESERRSGSSASLVWSLVNAAQAMRRCGRLAESMNYLEEAFELANHKKLPTRACTVAHHLILCALALDDSSVAKKWWRIARSFVTPDEDLHTQQEFQYYSARIALREGRVKEAFELCDKITAEDDQSLLRRISLLALKVRIAIERKAPLDSVSEQLKAFGALYEMECNRGGQDFEAYSLFLGRNYVGEETFALRQLQDYVSLLRRERGAPSHEIVSALRRYAKAGERTISTDTREVAV